MPYNFVCFITTKCEDPLRLRLESKTLLIMIMSTVDSIAAKYTGNEIIVLIECCVQVQTVVRVR